MSQFLSDFYDCAAVVLIALTDPEINIDPCLCDNWGIHQLPTYSKYNNICANVNYAISVNDACLNVIPEVKGGISYVKYYVCKFSLSQCADSPYAAVGFATLAVSLISSTLLRYKANVIMKEHTHNKFLKIVILLLLILSISLSAASNITSDQVINGQKVYCKNLNVKYINYSSIISNILTSLAALYILFDRPKLRWYFANICLLLADAISCGLNLYAYVITPGLQGEITLNGYFGIICIAIWSVISLLLMIITLIINKRNSKPGDKYVGNFSICMWLLTMQLRIPQILVLITMTEASVTNKIALYVGPYLSKSGALLNVGKIAAILAGLMATLLVKLGNKRQHAGNIQLQHVPILNEHVMPNITRNESSYIGLSK